MAVVITLTESSQQVMFSVAKRKSKSKQVWKFKLVYTQFWISFSTKPVRGAGAIPLVWPICKLPTSCIPSTCVGHPKSVLREVDILRIFVTNGAKRSCNLAQVLFVKTSCWKDKKETSRSVHPANHEKRSCSIPVSVWHWIGKGKWFFLCQLINGSGDLIIQWPPDKGKCSGTGKMCSL